MQFEEIEGRAEMKVLIVVDMQKDFVDGSLGGGGKSRGL